MNLSLKPWNTFGIERILPKQLYLLKMNNSC